MLAFSLSGAALAQTAGTVTTGSPLDMLIPQIDRPFAGPGVRDGNLVGGLNRPQRNPNAQMLVQADEIIYDYNRERVVASGRVQIYYNGSTLEAARVVYDQKTKRLRAEGNVRLTEPGGNVIRASVLELSDDFRDGFVDSLRITTPDNARFAANRGDRKGDLTVMQQGIYTACETCKENPQRPPLWQVKAARIVHNETERTIYFEKGSFEMFGIPIGYVPFFTTPDWTVKRKTGLLMPRFSASSKYGISAETPYFWAIAPNYDLTLTPRLMTGQGFLPQFEWRHRLETGYYTISGSGIYQLDKDVFRRDDAPSDTPGFRDWRGHLHTTGRFGLGDQWVLGWDGWLLSDRAYLSDYGLVDLSTREVTSQIFLSGQGARSTFDIRVQHYTGLSEFDRQSEIPVVAPVMDYKYVFGQPMLGGEVTFQANLTSLNRSQADFDAINAFRRRGDGSSRDAGILYCDGEASSIINRVNCLMRGAPGSYTRLSADLSWRRTVTDPWGQQFTPFASLRGDAAWRALTTGSGVGQFVSTSDQSVVRGMPTVGLEYRWPFASVQKWGTQIIEPIVQFILRPDEQQLGRLPNEDAQALVFDDTNLFSVDKFSGWDRMEGGGRVNYGIQYTAHFNNGAMINTLFGQSYQMFGLNSYAVGDMANTGLDSGLETRRSDYVGRVMFSPNSTVTLIARARFDERTYDPRAIEVEGRARFERWSHQVLYGNYDPQPELGYLTQREVVSGLTSYRFTRNWSLHLGARFDLRRDQFDQTLVGLSYLDDCYSFAAVYTTDNSYSNNAQRVHRVMLNMSFRTLGDGSVTPRLDNATESVVR